VGHEVLVVVVQAVLVVDLAMEIALAVHVVQEDAEIVSHLNVLNQNSNKKHFLFAVLPVWYQVDVDSHFLR
jgi:hypothetical protein